MLAEKHFPKLTNETTRWWCRVSDVSWPRLIRWSRTGSSTPMALRLVVDALFKPHGIVLEEAQAVAADLGLPHWWLNEQVMKRRRREGQGGRIREMPTDIRQLTEVLNLHTVADVLALVQDIFTEEEPPVRLRLLLEDIFDQSN